MYVKLLYMDTTQGERLLTTAEVAAIAQVKPVTVGRWVADGLLRPAIVTPGGHRRFRRGDVDAILDPGNETSKAS